MWSIVYTIQQVLGFLGQLLTVYYADILRLNDPLCTQFFPCRMLSKILLFLIITSVGADRVSNNGWFDRTNRVEWKAVSTLYMDMKADMKAKGSAGHHIGKTESDQLMIHNSQGLLPAQQYTISESAQH